MSKEEELKRLEEYHSKPYEDVECMRCVNPDFKIDGAYHVALCFECAEILSRSAFKAGMISDAREGKE